MLFRKGDGESEIEKDEREQDYGEMEKQRINGGRGRDAISGRAIGRGRRDRDGGRYDGADKAAEKRDGSNKLGREKGVARKCRNVKKIKCGAKKKAREFNEG